MRAWRLASNGRALEVWTIDDETGEISPKVMRLQFKQRVTLHEARLWMTNHYPRSRSTRAGALQ